MFAAWWRQVVRRWRRGSGKRGRAARRRESFTRCWVEPLEDRVVPSTFKWNADASGSWTNPANWSLVSGAGLFPNAAGDVAEFGNIITATRTVTIPTATTITVGSIQLDSGHNYVIAGTDATSVLQFQVAAGSATLAVTNVNGNAADTLSVGVKLASDLSVSNGSTGALTLSGGAQGAQSLSYSGSASSNTLVIGGTNTYTGSTTVSAGTLQDGADNALPTATALSVSGGATFDLNGHPQQVASLTGTGTVTDNSATASTFTVNDSGADTFAGVITDNSSTTTTGTLALVKQGGGTLALTGANTYAGNTTVSAGTLQIGSGGTTGSITGDVTDNATLAFDRSDAVTFAGAITGTGSLTQLGSGTLTLTNTDTYSGGTTISAGTLQVGAGGTAGSITGNVTDNASLAFDRSDAVAFGGTVSGGGGLTQLGAGTLTLSVANTYTGSTTVSAGTLQDGADNALPTGTALSIGGGATFDLNGHPQQVAAVTGTGSVTDNSATASAFTVNDPTADTFGGVIADGANAAVALVKKGAGTLTLTNANTYSGGTTISAGTLQVGNGGTTGSIAGNVTDNGALAFDRSDSVTFAGTIGGSGSLTQLGAGSLTLTGADTYGGGTTISAGSLQIGGGGTTGSIMGNVTDNASLVFDRADAVSFGGDISGGGNVAQAGAGSLTLGGNNTYAGTTTVTAGTLADGTDNALPVGTALSVGGGATLDLNGHPQQVASVTGTGSVTDNSATPSTFTVNDASADTFDGAIADGTGTVALVKMGAGTLTLTGASTYTGGTTISAGTLQIGGGGTTGSITGNVTDSGTLAFDRSDSVSFGGNVSGGGGLTQLGGGTLTLTGTNSYAGATTVSAGTLAGALPTGTALMVAAGAFYDLAGQGAQVSSLGGSGTVENTSATAATLAVAYAGASADTFAGSLGTGGGNNFGLTKQGSGTLVLTGAGTYTGGTTISAGTLQVGGGGTTGSITGNVTDNGALTFDRSDNVTFAGDISGTGSLTQAGNGIFILTGTGTYGGGTTISSGTLRVGNGGTTGSITGNVTDNGTLAFDRSDSVTFAGNISGGGGLIQAGTGTVSLTGTNSYAGATTVSAGTLAGALPSGTALTVAAGAFFDLAGQGAQVSSLGGSGTVENTSATAATLTVNYSGASADTFAGSLGTGGGNNFALSKQGSGTLALTGPGTYTGGTTIGAGTLQVGGGGTTGSITGDVTDNGSLVFDRSDTVTFGGAISGTGSLTQAGGGTLILTGTDTYGGGTTISAGTLQVGNGGTAGSITGDVTDNGALAFDRSDVVTFPGAISGTGGLTQLGAGTLTLTGTDTYGGGTTISAGTLQVGNGGTAGSITGDVTDNGSLVFDRSDSIVFAGNISGTGGLTQLGAGTLTLTGTDTYGGGTTISAGTLQVGNGGTAGSITGNVTDNGSLVFDHSDTVTFGGTIGGSGSLIQAGSGTLILTNTDTYGGGTTINAGTLQIGNGGTTGSITGNVTDNGGLVFDRSDSITFAGNISGGGNLTQAGTGTLTLTGTNTYTGTTTILAGTLAGSLPAGTALSLGGGVVFDMAGASLQLSSLTGTGTVENTGAFATLTIKSATADTFGGNLGAVAGNNFALIKDGAGTLTLTGPGTYTGGTTVKTGTLQIGGGGTTGSITGNVTDNGTLAFDRSDTVSFGGNISGSGGLTQLGAGTLTLTGTNTYAGATTVSAGTLAGALPTGTALTVAAGAFFDLAGQGAQVSSLGGSGTVENTSATAATLAVNYAGASADTFAGSLGTGGGNNFALNKQGGGTLALTGPGTYTGGTTVSAGILQVGSGGTTGSITGNVTDNASFVVNRSDSLTLAGNIGGTGSLTQAGGGTLILTGAGTYGGGTTISAGTLQVGNGGTTGSIAGSVTDNGSLVFDRSDAASLAGAITATGSLTQQGTGTLTLTGTDTYGGGTTVSAGTLQIGNGGTAGSITGNVTDNGTLAFDRSDAVTFPGTISGTGGLTQLGTGTLTLTATDPYGGGTTISAGTLQIGNGGTVGSITGNVTDNGALAFDHSDTVTFGGTVSGTGGLAQVGTGTLALTGTSGYSGLTTIQAGTVQVTGQLTNSAVKLNNLSATLTGTGSVHGITSGVGGTVAAGLGATPGTLTSTGAVALNNKTTLVIHLSGHSGSSLALTGSLLTGLNLNGATLSVLGQNGSSVEDVFTLVSGTGAATASQFGQFSLEGSPPQSATDGAVITVAGQQYQLAYAGGSGVQSLGNTNVILTHLDLLNDGTGVVPQTTAQGNVFPMPFQRLATFTGQLGGVALPAGNNVGRFLVLVDWGDGTHDATVPLPGDGASVSLTRDAQGTFAVSGGHTYGSPGKYTISVTVVIDGNFDGQRDQTVNFAGLPQHFSELVVQDFILLGNNNSEIVASTLFQQFANQAQISTAALGSIRGIKASPAQKQALTITGTIELIYSDPTALAKQVQAIYRQFHFVPSQAALISGTHYLAQVGDREGLSLILASSRDYWLLAGQNLTTFVRNLYRDYYNQPSPAAAQVSRWVTSGLSPAAIARAFITGYWGDYMQIQYLYNAILRRNATTAEVNFYEARRPQMTFKQIALDIALHTSFTALLQVGKFTTGAVSFADATQLVPFVAKQTGGGVAGLIASNYF